MKPFGPLMKEHRCIERMVELLKKLFNYLKEGAEIDVLYMDRLIRDGVDFFRTYADRTHHGKEEDILFTQLNEKDLSKKHRQIMDQLVKQHMQARESVSKLDSEMQLYLEERENNQKHKDNVMQQLEFLVNLYPGHIDQEDNQFFRPVMDYFSEEEQSQMLNDFFEFDQQMIHEKYEKVVSGYEKDQSK